MQVVEGDITAQATQVFKNLEAVAAAAGGTLNDAVKINISLTDLGDFAAVNAVMATFLQAPYPARALSSRTSLAVSAGARPSRVSWDLLPRLVGFLLRRLGLRAGTGP